MIATNNYVMNLLYDMSQQISNDADLSELVGFTSKMFVGNGDTYCRLDAVRESYVGIKELSSNPNGYTDEYTFMKAFISVLHETTHIYQCEKVFDMSNPSARYVALGRVAEQCSGQYYIDNYKLMPQEISAQYSALKNGYKILSDWYGDEKANSMICDYVNKHIEDEFIDKPKKPYKDVYVVFRDYKSVFKKSRNIKREVNLDSFKEYAKNSLEYLKANGLDEDDLDTMSKRIICGKTQCVDYVSEQGTGVEQDFFLTGIFLSDEEDGTYAKHNFKSLSNMNFDYKMFSFKYNPKSIRNFDLDSITPNLSNMTINGKGMEFL